MKTFNVPIIYRSPLINAIKSKRKQQDKMKRDYTPTLLDFGPLRICLARHFGFCYGVENAIEISFRTIDENPDKRRSTPTCVHAAYNFYRIHRAGRSSPSQNSTPMTW